MKISEVLRDCANNRLWDGTNFNERLDVSQSQCEIDSAFQQGKKTYSCDTFHPEYNYQVSFSFKREIENFLASLGLPWRSRNAFEEFEAGEERQSVRYAWLMFAADVAEEEGL